MIKVPVKSEAALKRWLSNHMLIVTGEVTNEQDEYERFEDMTFTLSQIRAMKRKKR